jgi:hypothetical protein
MELELPALQLELAALSDDESIARLGCSKEALASYKPWKQQQLFRCSARRIDDGREQMPCSGAVRWPVAVASARRARWHQCEGADGTGLSTQDRRSSTVTCIDYCLLSIVSTYT